MQPDASWTRFFVVSLSMLALGLGLTLSVRGSGPTMWLPLACIAVTNLWLAFGYVRLRRVAAADPGVLRDYGRMLALMFGSRASVAGLVLSLALVVAVAIYAMVAGR